MYGEKSMKKTTQTETRHRISITLAGGRTADFYYSDLAVATAHYQTIKAAGQLGGVWVINSNLIPAASPHLVA
jgi:hypothetical protein